jgi:hypothetical protein
MNGPRDIEIWADWVELGGAHRLGTLRVEAVRGRDLHAFSYATAWLAGGTAPTFQRAGPAH